MNGSQPGKLLSEADLVLISRTARTCVPTSSTISSTIPLEDQIQQFSSLLDNVLHVSNLAALNGSHRVAAWNTLCSLIDQAVKSDLPELDDALWDLDVWSRTLDIYIGHAQTARPKSSRQLMTSLTKALQKNTKRDLTPVRQSTTERLVQCLLDLQSPFKAKVSAQLLGHLLLKDVTTLEDVLDCFDAASSGGFMSSLEAQATLTLETLFRWLGVGDFSSTISQFVSIFLDQCDTSEKLSKSLERPLWAVPLARAFAQGAVNLDDLRVHLLPALFKRSFADFVSFLRMQGLEGIGAAKTDEEAADNTSQDLLCAALQTGKEMGLLLETEELSVVHNSNVLLIPVRTIGSLLRQSSRAARLTGLVLLTTSHSATRPIPLPALTLIRQNLDILFADVDADFRSGVFSALQRLIDRIRAITAVLARQADQQKSAEISSAATAQNKHVLQYHKTFLKQMLSFLAWELRPTASYQRHISAVKCIAFLARSGLDEHVPRECLSKTALGETKWPFHLRVVTEDLQRLLLDLCLDPFDDVRQAAASVLGFYTSTAATSGLLSQEYLASTLERAETIMLATGRADHADGVAHVFALCYRRCEVQDSSHDPTWKSRTSFYEALIEKLDRLLNLAQESLADAVQKYPIHGLLTSLRYILVQDPKAVDAESKRRLIRYLHEIWELVKPILCDDAPEGFVPDAMEMSPESTKETLSYCWRALKEASLLLSALVSIPTAADDATLLETMSSLCFTQLAELRHRGAFSTVAQTWTFCCMQCHDLKEADTSISMLHVWYGKVLDMLKNNVTINTRRSAGLPSLLCGILIADQSGRLLERAFADMEDIARQEVNSKSAEEGSLAQVHAMNCLKDILKTTRLGEKTQQHVPTALQLAADALRSEVWAVRNCGLMLFRAVIDRLLGTNEAHLEDDVIKQKRNSVEQHPALLDVLLGLLPSSELASNRYEGVFPALSLLQHTQIPESRLEETKSAVAGLTASPSWHVRDKAARTLASLVAGDNVHQHFETLLQCDCSDQNRLHGSMLIAKYMILGIRRTSGVSTTKLSEDSLDEEDTWCRYLQMLNNILNSTPSFVVKAACIDVVSSILRLTAEANPARDLSIFHDFNADFDVSSDHSSAAVLRQAWARYAAHRIRHGQFDDRNEALALSDKVLSLADRDPDAAAYFFNAVDWSSARGCCSADRGEDCGVTVAWFCVDVLTKDTLDVRLKFEARRVLLSLQTDVTDLLRAKRVGDLLDSETSGHINNSRHHQASIDQLLSLRTLQLEATASTASQEAVSAWAVEVTAAIKSNGIHTRDAEATSLSLIDDLWTRLTLATWTDLCLSAYDLLNDDDEDVRLLAAGIVARIIAASNPTQSSSPPIFEPIAASQQLLATLHRRYTASDSDPSPLTSIALSRAFESSSTATPSPVAVQLASLSSPDTALFAEEKQNLYLDESREVRIWAKYLQRLPPPAFSEKQFAAFTTWVFDGLTHLSSTTSEPLTIDGPLGWTTKEETIFTLGLRVILGVEVLFAWVAKGVRLTVRPSDLRLKVFACVKSWEERKVNCLWREELERVLAEAVVGKTRAVDGVARFVAGVEGRKLI